jgi:hypothetical protein
LAITTQYADGSDPLATCASPTLPGNIEDDAVRILELPLEIFLFGVITKIEEKLSARRLDPFLCFLEIVDLEAEVQKLQNHSKEKYRMKTPVRLAPLASGQTLTHRIWRPFPGR